VKRNNDQLITTSSTTIRAAPSSLESPFLSQTQPAVPPICDIEYHFSIKGLKCEGCAARLKAALLNSHAAVSSVQVYFDNKEVYIRVQDQEGEKLEVQRIKELVAEVDFTYILEELGRERKCK
jgi:copper chaperone CopZ